jgi:putative tryptophan/tyrosine transport system substrate-binding protein
VWPLTGWTLVAVAQAKRTPVVIGWLHVSSREAGASTFIAFKEGLAGLGLKEGAHVLIEARWADGRVDRLPALAEELAAKKPAVIVANSAQVAHVLVKAAPDTPIVQATGTNPVESGLAASLARPGGMLTGLTNLASELSEKLVELLIAIAPKVKRVGFLIHFGTRGIMPGQLDAARRSASRYAVEAHFAHPTKPEEVEPAFEALAKQRVQALIVMPTPFFVAERPRIISLAQAQRWPLVATSRTWAEQGALLSYGIDNLANFRRAAWYVDRILKGTKPGDLPIEQPTTFELLVNLKTAKALGITIPQSVLLQASRVIE